MSEAWSDGTLWSDGTGWAEETGMVQYFVKNRVGDVGNDSADGLSEGTAWATITKLNSVPLNPGDIVNFVRGSRFDDATLRRACVGTSANPLVFRASGVGAKPIIAGGPVVTGWTDTGADWRASLTRAPLEICQDEWKYLTVAASRASMVAGTYFYDAANNHLYIRTIEDDNPAGHLIEAQCLNRCIYPTACSWFTIEDIDMRAAVLSGWLVDTGNVTGLIMRRMEARACKQYGIYIAYSASQLAPNTNILVEDCEGHFCGADGMHLGGYYQGVTVARLRTSNNCFRPDIDWTAGFRSVGDDWSTGLILIDPWSWDNGTFGTPPPDGGYGVWFDAILGGCAVLGGRLWGNRFFGLDVERVKGDSPANGCQVIGVMAWRNGTVGQSGGGITIRTHSDFCLVAQCVCWDNALNNYHFTGFAEPLVAVIARNNIGLRGPVNPTAYALTVFDPGASGGLTLDHNCFGPEGTAFARWETNTSVDTYAELEAEYGGEMSNVEADPQLLDPENGDFRIGALSPCRDAGIDVGLPFYGVAPDIGAFELEPEGAVTPDFLGVTGALKPIGALLPTGGFRFLEPFAVSIELVTEQTLAQPLGTRLKAKAVAFAAEAATGLPLAKAKVAAAGLAAETALAQPVTGLSTRTAALAAETTAALATVRAKSRVVGLTVETDTAFGIVSALAVVLGLAAEGAAALVVTRTKLAGALGLTTVTEIAPGLGRAKLRAVGPTIGADTAELVGRLHTRTIEFATTIEIAQPATPARILAAGLAGSLEQALGVLALIEVEIGFAQELAAVLPLAPVVKLRTAGLALEPSEALPVTVIGQIIGVAGLALQAEIAFDLGRQKLQDIAPAADSVETAFGLALPTKTGTAQLGTSLEVAFPISASVGTAAGLAESIEIAFPAGKRKLGIMHREDEVATALALAAAAKIATAAFAATLETSLQLSANLARVAGQAASTAAALPAVANKAHLSQLVTSLEQAIGVFVSLGDEVGPTSSLETALGVGKHKERQVERADELAIAPAPTGRKAGAILLTSSVEQALAVSLQIAGQAGLAVDLATALDLGRSKFRGANEGQEVSQALLVTLRIGSQVGMAGEIGLALQIDGRAKGKAIGFATEAASALFALQFVGAMRYIALRGRMVERVTLHGRHGL